MEFYKSRIIMLHKQLEIAKRGFLLSVKDIVQSMGEDIENVEAASKKISDLREAYNQLIEDIRDSIQIAKDRIMDLEESHEV